MNEFIIIHSTDLPLAAQRYVMLYARGSNVIGICRNLTTLFKCLKVMTLSSMRFEFLLKILIPKLYFIVAGPVIPHKNYKKN